MRHNPQDNALLGKAIIEDFDPTEMGISNSSIHLADSFEPIEKDDPSDHQTFIHQPTVNNQIPKLKDIFSKLVAYNIATKTLNKEPFTDLSDTHLSDLETLDLRNKNLEKLKDDSNRLLQLIAFGPALKCSIDQIYAIHELKKAVRLKTLNLAQNNLSTISDDFFRLTSLEKLDLSKNALTDISDQIGQLVNLNQLNLESNKLTTLPQEIATLTNLKTLGLNENPELSLPFNLLERFANHPQLDPIAILNSLKKR